MEYCGISYLIREGVFAILVFSFIRGKNQILFAGFFYSASRLAYSCYLLYKFFKVSGKIPLAADPAICKTLLKNAAPIGLIYIFSQVIWNFGLISLGIWETKESVGYYNAALKPILFYLRERYFCFSEDAVSLPDNAVFPSGSRRSQGIPQRQRSRLIPQN